MFVQVIEGRTANAAALQELLARWDTDVEPGPTGLLGTTADGSFIEAACFTSET